MHPVLPTLAAALLSCAAVGPLAAQIELRAPKGAGHYVWKQTKVTVVRAGFPPLQKIYDGPPELAVPFSFEGLGIGKGEKVRILVEPPAESPYAPIEKKRKRWAKKIVLHLEVRQYARKSELDELRLPTGGGTYPAAYESAFEKDGKPKLWLNSSRPGRRGTKYFFVPGYLGFELERRTNGAWVNSSFARRQTAPIETLVDVEYDPAIRQLVEGQPFRVEIGVELGEVNRLISVEGIVGKPCRIAWLRELERANPGQDHLASIKNLLTRGRIRVLESGEELRRSGGPAGWTPLGAPEDFLVGRESRVLFKLALEETVVSLSGLDRSTVSDLPVIRGSNQRMVFPVAWGAGVARARLPARLVGKATVAVPGYFRAKLAQSMRMMPTAVQLRIETQPRALIEDLEVIYPEDGTIQTLELAQARRTGDLITVPWTMGTAEGVLAAGWVDLGVPGKIPVRIRGGRKLLDGDTIRLTKPANEADIRVIVFNDFGPSSATFAELSQLLDESQSVAADAVIESAEQSQFLVIGKTQKKKLTIVDNEGGLERHAEELDAVHRLVIDKLLEQVEKGVHRTVVVLVTQRPGRLPDKLPHELKRTLASLSSRVRLHTLVFAQPGNASGVGLGTAYSNHRLVTIALNEPSWEEKATRAATEIVAEATKAFRSK